MAPAGQEREEPVSVQRLCSRDAGCRLLRETGCPLALCPGCDHVTTALATWRAGRSEPPSRAAILAEVMRDAGVTELGRYHLTEGELCMKRPSFTHEELAAMYAVLINTAPGPNLPLIEATAKLNEYMRLHEAANGR